MKITSIEKYKGDTFRVIIDGNKKVYLHREIIQKFSLEPSCEIKSETLTEILYASDLRRARKIRFSSVRISTVSSSISSTFPAQRLLSPTNPATKGVCGSP